MALTRPRAYQIYDIDYKQATRVVTVSNITLAGGAPNTVDSVSLAVNDRILVTGQSTASQNGIYVVATLGTGSNGTWIRSIDTDATGELLAGTIVMVTEGAVYQDTQWKLITNDPITIGVTGLVFVQNYSANSISSGTSNVTVLDSSSVLISSAGQANVVKVDAANITISANIIPSANVVYSLGTPTSRFKDLWISNNTIYLGNTTLESNNNSLFVNGAQVATVTAGDNLSLTGNLVASGNVTANGNVSGTYILGNVAFATGIPATYGNANVADYLASGTDTSNIVTTGNVQGAYIIGNGIALSSINAANIAGTVANASYADNANYATYSGTAFSVSGANVSGQVANALVAGTVYTAAQPNITSVGTLTSVDVSGNVSGGNLLTGGIVSATGNVSGGNVVATNWIKSQDISATGNAYINGFISVTGNLYVANVVSQGNLTVDDPLLYLTANAPYPYNYDVGFFSQFQTSPGDPTQANGYQHTGFVRDQSDGVWKLFSNVLPEPTSTINFNDAVYDALLVGSVSATGNISAVGNVTGNYFFGNGSQLTGIVAGATTTASNTAPVSPAQGDIWIDLASGIQYIYFNDGTSNQWAEMEAYQIFSSGGSATVAGSNTQIQFNNSGSLGASSNLTFNSATNVLTVTGNISGTYIIGNGSQLTGLPAGYTNSNVTTLLAAFGSNTISSTGNITTTANISGGYIIGNGSQLTGLPAGYADSNVTTLLAALGSNVISSTGNITTTANISGSYILGNGSQLTGISGGPSNTSIRAQAMTMGIILGN